MEMLSKAVKFPKMKQAHSSSASSCVVKLNSSEVVECLINSDLPTMSQSLSGVRPAEDTLMHETGANIVSSLLDQMLSSVLARAPSLQASLPI